MNTIIRHFVLGLAAGVFLLCSVDSRASETDTRIESSAMKSYVFKTILKGDDITIHSKDGAVTLSGTVSEESHKPLARETVASLPGVVSVDNKLEVKTKVPAAFTDAWLITKVKTTLLFHRNVNGTKTEVSSRDGVVTLQGVANSDSQKALTARHAGDVEGVKDVINQMTVSVDAAKPGNNTLGEKVDVFAESIDDASTTALVKTALLYHRSTSALTTSVDTKDGVVTLSGKVKSTAEKEMATILVSDVYGVKKVLNNITVE